jgi:hypothetical protein
MIGISENAVLASCAAWRTDIVAIAGDPGKMNRQWLAQFKTGDARVASVLATLSVHTRSDCTQRQST